MKPKILGEMKRKNMVKYFVTVHGQIYRRIIRSVIRNAIITYNNAINALIHRIIYWLFDGKLWW